ncbi:hypothetical protein LCGC14_0175200 [marine sediment metagenome]|uniref:Uncharacterized protein n=1 Tax=marine sediment metagenome TaxID=412755 RepID=A0A0F9X9I9_9ZZZZ
MSNDITSRLEKLSKIDQSGLSEDVLDALESQKYWATVKHIENHGNKGKKHPFRTKTIKHSEEERNNLLKAARHEIIMGCFTSQMIKDFYRETTPNGSDKGTKRTFEEDYENGDVFLLDPMFCAIYRVLHPNLNTKNQNKLENNPLLIILRWCWKSKKKGLVKY